MYISSFELYSSRVRTLTETIYQMNIEKIDPTRKRGLFHELDHKCSIYDCFHANPQIPIEIAAAVENLEIITAETNAQKGADSSMTPQMLRESVRLTMGQALAAYLMSKRAPPFGGV